MYTSILAMGDETTLRVSRSTWRQLHERKEPGDSMDDVLSELIDEIEGE